MDYPQTFSDSKADITGLGLAARIAAPAAIVLPNEAGTAACEHEIAVVAARSPRQVIRGENHSKEPNPAAAFVDWLNFTFKFHISSTSDVMALDVALQKSFGFGLGMNRGRGHLNYEQSWELGNCYGIFATGGHSVGGTSMVTLSGEGCCVISDWLAVYDFLVDYRARITRIDLAHDDYRGRITLPQLREWFEAGDFATERGRPPKGRYVDDFGDGTGKTLYVGNRKNGKLLRVYEKGKQLGDPTSDWVRWEVELHNKDRVIPLMCLLQPARYLAAAYPLTGWISEKQCRIETAKRALNISLDVLTESAKNSYGKFLWVCWKVLDMTPQEILEMLAVEGTPRRLNHAIPGELGCKP